MRRAEWTKRKRRPRDFSWRNLVKNYWRINLDRVRMPKWKALGIDFESIRGLRLAEMNVGRNMADVFHDQSRKQAIAACFYGHRNAERESAVFVEGESRWPERHGGFARSLFEFRNIGDADTSGDRPDLKSSDRRLTPRDDEWNEAEIEEKISAK